MSTTPPRDGGKWMRSADGPLRTIYEADGREWHVYEIDASSYDRRGGKALVFDTFDVVRRVRTFPSDWHQLPDEELLALQECL